METSLLSSAKDKVKDFFHEKIDTTKEVTGGTWDAKRNVYSVTDSATGVTTEYRIKKNPTVETGLSAKIGFFKEVPDEKTGTTRKVEVSFNDKKASWEPKSKFAQSWDNMAYRPKYMATLKEAKSAESADRTYTLTVSPAKFKPHERPPVIVMPPTPPIQGTVVR